MNVMLSIFNLNEYCNITQLLSLIAAIMSFTIIIAVFIKNKKKSLAYFVCNDYYLTCALGISDKEFVTTYENKKINSIRYFQIQIGNNGAKPIQVQDYEQEVILTFNQESRILDFEIDDKATNISDLTPTVSKDSNTVIIKPLLLNKRDYFTLNLLIDDYNSFDGVVSKITGINDIKRVSDLNLGIFPALIALSISLIIFALASIEVTGEYELLIKRPIKNVPWFVNWVFGASLVMFLVSMFSIFAGGVRIKFFGSLRHPQSKYEKFRPAKDIGNGMTMLP